MGTLTTHSILDEAIQNRVEFVGLTVDQYESLIQTRRLPEDFSTELIDGFMVRKDRSAAGAEPTAVGNRHRMAIIRLTRLAQNFDAHGCFLQSQQPIAIPPHDEPEPDIAVIRGNDDEFVTRKPSPADTLFVLEVSDSSLRYDLTTKLRVYARAGIPVYVVVDLQNDSVLIHRQPVGESYNQTIRLGRDDILKLHTATDKHVEIPISRLL